MNKVNKIKMALISLALVNSCSMYSIGVQLQETSIHPAWYFTNSGAQLKRAEVTAKYRTVSDQLGGTENAKIPQKAANIVRVATYNVHFWRSPYSGWHTQDLAGYTNYEVDKIIAVIKEVNADVLLLQEVGGGQQNKWGSIKKMLEGEYNYKYVACASTAVQGVHNEGNLYNCIYSKYPFVGKTIEKQYATNPDLNLAMYKPGKANAEQRCFVGARIQLPNKKEISVYSTHLEVRPIMAKSSDGKGRGLSPDAARKEQMQELLEYIKTNDTNPNVVIGADFNTFRREDLEAYNISGRTLWDIMQKDWSRILKETAGDVPQGLGHLVDKTPTTMALDYVASEGYKDSFTRGGFMAPQFSVWTGTLIDFLFLSPKWNLGIKGGYVFYNWASDHMPVFMDIDPSKVIAPLKPTITKPTPVKPIITKPIPVKPAITKPVAGKNPFAGAAAKKAIQTKTKK